MIVSKEKNPKISSLLIDENEKVIEIEPLIYFIQLKDEEEYNTSECIIEKALDIGLDVFQYTSNAPRLSSYDCNKILLSYDMIIVIETNNKNKFEELENLMRWFILKNKEYINNI